MIYEIEPRQSTEFSTSAYWENFLTEEDLDEILNLPEWKDKELSLIQDNENPNIRMSEVAWMYPTAKNDHLWKKITRAVANVNQSFFHYDLTGCYEPAQLSIYSEQLKGFYNWHIDERPPGRNIPRKLSVSILLNDPSEFEGGEMQILEHSDKPTTLEFKRGRAWFFPSHVIHRVTPVTKGVRKSLVLWVGGPAFK